MTILTIALLMLVSAAFGYMVAQREAQELRSEAEARAEEQYLRLLRDCQDRVRQQAASVDQQVEERMRWKQEAAESWKRACDDITNEN